ncbi:hypothetical protein N7504_005482 [Penicillium tannophilum]|nr:hypothetical protein N7504_005482 [Penicillium tannophilum]
MLFCEAGQSMALEGHAVMVAVRVLKIVEVVDPSGGVTDDTCSGVPEGSDTEARIEDLEGNTEIDSSVFEGYGNPECSEVEAVVVKARDIVDESRAEAELLALDDLFTTEDNMVEDRESLDKETEVDICMLEEDGVTTNDDTTEERRLLDTEAAIDRCLLEDDAIAPEVEGLIADVGIDDPVDETLDEAERVLKENGGEEEMMLEDGDEEDEAGDEEGAAGEENADGEENAANEEDAANDEEGAANDEEGAANDEEGAANDEEGAANDEEGAANDEEGAANDEEGAAGDEEDIAGEEDAAGVGVGPDVEMGNVDV